MSKECTDKYPCILQSSLGYGVMYAELTSLSVMLAHMILWLHVLFTHLNIVHYA